MPYFDLLDYVSMMVQKHTYLLVVAKIDNFKIPEKAKVIRVIFANITLILNHLLTVGYPAMNVEAMTSFLCAEEKREKLI